MKLGTVRYKNLQEGSNIIKPNYHLNYGKRRISNSHKNGASFKTLGELTSNIYTGGIFKRMFVENQEYGLPYISAIHMMNTSPLEVSKSISRKHTPKQEDMKLADGQILVSCAGTVGNVRLITKDLDGIIGSQDIIRIISDNNKAPFGFIYAYLSSPTMYNFMQSYIYGSVVPRIDPKTLSNLPIIEISTDKQLYVHNLILKASSLRVTANKLLTDAISILESVLPKIDFNLIYTSKLTQRINHSSRLEASYNATLIDNFKHEVIENGAELKTISSLSESVFTPGIFKRVRANNNHVGIPYLSGSDLLNQMPIFDSFLSKKMKNIDNYILKEGWLAIQDAGTIGYLTLITEFLDGVSATNNLVRVKPGRVNYNYYIYCFFKTKIGQKLLRNLEYGSVQKHIDHHQIGSFEIPIYHLIFENVSENIRLMMQKTSDACFLEKEAIDIIEKEIESWQ